jgi:hypothetical protein
MTDDDIDDVMANAAVVQDSDLRSPAVTAALLAAMEALIPMSDRSDRPLHAPPGAIAEPYVSPVHTGRPRGRRALALAAALVLVAVGAAGITKLVGGDEPAERADSGAADVALNPDCPVEDLAGGLGPGGPQPTLVDPDPGRFPEDPGRFSEPAPGTVQSLLADCTKQSLPEPGPYPDPTLPPDASAAPPAGAPLADRVEFALRLAYLDNVVRIVTTSDTELKEITADEQTGSMRVVLSDRVAGSDRIQPFADTGVSGFDGSAPTGERSVNHCRGQYYDYDGANPRSTNFSALAADLRSGTVVEDGHETIDGRDTLRLRNTQTGGFTWLDAATLRPVRSTHTSVEQGAEETTYEFLPRTEENLARLVPSVEGLTLADSDTGAEHCPPGG